jgi:hypothetical protein
MSLLELNGIVHLVYRFQKYSSALLLDFRLFCIFYFTDTYILLSILTTGGNGQRVQVCWETTWKELRKEGSRLVTPVSLNS